MFEEAFEDVRNHLLLKTIGVYTLNWLAADILEWCRIRRIEATEATISQFLAPLSGFNWRGKDPSSSPLRGLGGRAGVSEAYKLLLKRLADGGITEAEEKLRKLVEAEETRARRG